MMLVKFEKEIAKLGYELESFKTKKMYSVSKDKIEWFNTLDLIKTDENGERHRVESSGGMLFFSNDVNITVEESRKLNALIKEIIG